MKMISIKTMIAQIIRDARIKDATYAEDMLEWIPGIMGELQTGVTLISKSALVQVQFHKAPLPCGLEAVRAVTLGGHSRLHYNDPDTDVNYAHPVHTSSPGSIFLSVGKTSENIQDMELPGGAQSSYNESTLVPYNQLPFCQYWYRDLPEVLETSLVSGILRIHFLSIPVDELGYVLIPDNENYKRAVYYGVRLRLIEAGYPENGLNWNLCSQQFEHYAGRALGEIRYPSIDKMASMHRNLTRLIPPANYYENFSSNQSEESYPHNPWQH